MRWTMVVWGFIGSIVLVGSVALAGCDDGGTSGETDPGPSSMSGASDTEDSGEGPAGCEAGQVSASGDVAGVGRDLSGARTARLLNQLGDPATLDLGGAGDISFHFEWSGGPQSNGVPFAVTGWMSLEGTEHCFSGMLTLDDGGFDTFNIGEFAERDAEMCGAAVEGSLMGCSDAS